MTRTMRLATSSLLRSLNLSSRPALWFALCIALLVGTGGCATATPVTPAPLAPARASELESTLPGTWLWMASSKKLNGPKDGVGGLYEVVRRYTFNADGTMKLGNTKGTWALDGANLATTLTFKNARVEKFSATDLTLFIYDNSTFMYFERK